MNHTELWKTLDALSMTKLLKPSRKGMFELKHFQITKKEVDFERLRGAINPNQYREVYNLVPGKYIKLIEHTGPDDTPTHSQVIWMTDTPMERRTNFHFLYQANGDVLVAGLGIGLIIIPLLKKPEVRSVTVVELNKNVIDLVAPQLPRDERLRIICADIFKFKDTTPMKWDTIYFDIWPNVSEDNYEQMKKLHRMYARRLNRDNPNAWMGSWRRDDCKPNRRW